MRPRSLIWITLLITLAGAVWVIRKEPDKPAPSTAKPPPPEILWRGNPPDQIQRDATEIFKKAFWKRPSPEDQILHAERHEWRDETGVTRWQWFLVVDPSPALIHRLRDENVFSLIPGEFQAVDEHPHWFRFNTENTTTLRSNKAGLQLTFDETCSRLYACSAGLGFRKAIQLKQGETLETSVAPLPSGRLPTTSPPVPDQATESP